MRTTDILFDVFEDIKTFNQYLYMSKRHTIIFNNGLTDLEISMDNDLGYRSKNLSFSHIPAIGIELSNMQICNIITQLKSKIVDFYGELRTQWEVIEEITKSHLAFNKDIGGIKW